MTIEEVKKKDIPDSPGIYFWKKGQEVLYIGRATSLKDRVKSYFANDLMRTRGPRIVDMVTHADDLKWQETDSVLEAIILEANLIKKFQPRYNVDDKDDKSWNYVGITKPARNAFSIVLAGGETLPKIVVVRGKNIDFKNQSTRNLSIGKAGYKFKKLYGPFTSGSLLREALKIIRKMFPFMDEKSGNKYSKEFYRQIGLTPNLVSSEAKNEYLVSIKNIGLFFEGKKKVILNGLNKQMTVFAKNRQFEKAEEIKRRIFALNHIRDISLIKSLEDSGTSRSSGIKLEAYDVAHTSGKESVGVMTTMIGNELNKSGYRKFKLSPEIGNNDIKSLAEIINRRFNHNEWQMPDIVVVDGGVGHRNLAMSLISKISKNIDVVAVIKNERHKPEAILGPENIVKKYRREILLINSEAHRFAITFHRKRLRNRE